MRGLLLWLRLMRPVVSAVKPLVVTDFGFLRHVRLDGAPVEGTTLTVQYDSVPPSVEVVVQWYVGPSRGLALADGIPCAQVFPAPTSCLHPLLLMLRVYH